MIRDGSTSVEVGENRFVFHPLIRLFAQELAETRQLQATAAERHTQFFIELVKSNEVTNRAIANEKINSKFRVCSQRCQR